MVIRKITPDSGELHLACYCRPDLSDSRPLQAAQTRERPDLEAV